ASVRGSFTKISAADIAMSKTVGKPELPVRSFLVSGTPEDIYIDVRASEVEVIENITVVPVQKESCRCATDEPEVFSMDHAAYTQLTPAYEVSYLGAFRGQPISRVDVYLARFDGPSQKLELAHEVVINSNAKVFSFPSEGV